MAEPVRYRLATDADHESIFRLAYETFVEEIPQYPPNPGRLHVDRFHADNHYVLALSGQTLVGMLAIRVNRPFSLDQKLGSVDPFLPPGRRPCEFRLLAVRKPFRRGPVFGRLVELAVAHGLDLGFDLALISGTDRQARLYAHAGFVPFGPAVGTAEARFQPMYLTAERFVSAAPRLCREGAPVSFLPGPVEVAPRVRAAFERPAISHRHPAFVATFARTRARLAALARSPHVEILVGSGTLANDVVAAQLARSPGPGLVLTNGEFGDRLVDHARRAGAVFQIVSSPWGAPFDLEALEQSLAAHQARWVWAVATETSTGMQNDVAALVRAARPHGASVNLDIVSALGAVPIDLRDVEFASGTSGKAIGGYPGLAFVFHHGRLRGGDRLPRYLDLRLAVEQHGIPFTHSSNLVSALDVALDRFDEGDVLAELASVALAFRARLDDLGLDALVPEAQASPAVVTIPLPQSLDSRDVARQLEARGLFVAAYSEYLVARNWIQVALMGAGVRRDLPRLVAALADRVAASRPAAPPRESRLPAAQPWG